MEQIFKNAKAIVEVMEKLPLEERTITAEIASKILQFRDQKAQQTMWANESAQRAKADAVCASFEGQT